METSCKHLLCSAQWKIQFWITHLSHFRLSLLCSNSSFVFIHVRKANRHVKFILSWFSVIPKQINVQIWKRLNQLHHYLLPQQLRCIFVFCTGAFQIPQGPNSRWSSAVPRSCEPLVVVEPFYETAASLSRETKGKKEVIGTVTTFSFIWTVGWK